MHTGIYFYPAKTFSSIFISNYTFPALSYAEAFFSPVSDRLSPRCPLRLKINSWNASSKKCENLILSSLTGSDSVSTFLNTDAECRNSIMLITSVLRMQSKVCAVVFPVVTNAL